MKLKTKTQTEELRSFVRWIEAEDRQDWEIERYVEDLLSTQRKEERLRLAKIAEEEGLVKLADELGWELDKKIMDDVLEILK